VLVVADYGQLELRLLAHMAGCVSMREAFEAGGDFHSRTAMGMYQEIKDAMERGEVLLEYGSEGYDEDGEAGSDSGAPKPQLVKDAFASERRKAKVLNFSIAYGKTAHGLAKDFGVSTKEAEETVQLWYSDRPEVRAWQEVQHRKAAEKGKVSTLLGRHRNLPEASSSDEARRQHALRASINTPIQGGAADIAMLAMIQIHRCPRLRELGYRMLMQIHDEVILEGPEEHKDEALALVKLHMEKPFNDHENLCDVDLNVDGDYAKTWFDAK
jgi:DNA polymerase-1